MGKNSLEKSRLYKRIYKWKLKGRITILQINRADDREDGVKKWKKHKT